MKLFKIEWSETVYYETTIEADTVEEAEESFFNGNADDIKQVDSNFEDISLIEEVE